MPCTRLCPNVVLLLLMLILVLAATQGERGEGYQLHTVNLVVDQVKCWHNLGVCIVDVGKRKKGWWPAALSF